LEFVDMPFGVVSTGTREARGWPATMAPPGMRQLEPPLAWQSARSPAQRYIVGVRAFIHFHGLRRPKTIVNQGRLVLGVTNPKKLT
jgi:hypothetical protein